MKVLHKVAFVFASFVIQLISCMEHHNIQNEQELVERIEQEARQIIRNDGYNDSDMEYYDRLCEMNYVDTNKDEHRNELFQECLKYFRFEFDEKIDYDAIKNTDSIEWVINYVKSHYTEKDVIIRSFTGLELHAICNTIKFNLTIPFSREIIKLILFKCHVREKNLNFITNIIDTAITNDHNIPFFLVMFFYKKNMSQGCNIIDDIKCCFEQEYTNDQIVEYISKNIDDNKFCAQLKLYSESNVSIDMATLIKQKTKNYVRKYAVLLKDAKIYVMH